MAEFARIIPADDYMGPVKDKLASLLEPGVFRTVLELAEELKAEYPEVYKGFVDNFTSQYALSGCGRNRGHINGLTIALDEMTAEGRAVKNVAAGVMYWAG